MMYGKPMKAEKSPSKKKGVPVTIMVAIGKPKMLPKKGQRTATNMMKKSTRGK
jgi:hypothetical protein|tara:strand:- start:294 stop:452 length:159 start_codon:yes stop_codon:yes gene_type:complete